MAVRMVKERLGMQSIKLSESTGLKESKNETIVTGKQIGRAHV